MAASLAGPTADAIDLMTTEATRKAHEKAKAESDSDGATRMTSDF